VFGNVQKLIAFFSGKKMVGRGELKLENWKKGKIGIFGKL
jgi:hypothetical protein